MSLYYPQVGVKLRITWEDFGKPNDVLKELLDLNIACKNVIVERNDYSEADTVKINFDYKAFPFDPRCIRACGISVFMENVKRVFDHNGIQVKIVPNDLPIGTKGANKVFIGFADESNIKFDDESRIVTFEGRDYTGLLIDQKRINSDPISLSKPLDQIITDLMVEQEATKEIQVVNRTGEELPTLAKLAADLNSNTSVKNQRRKETYWDIIQDLLSRVGLLGFIEIDKFVISKPQNIYEKRKLKQFIYGGNVKDLTFTRKLGRAKNFNVKVVSFDPLNKTVLEAKIPLEATTPGIAGPEVTIPQLDKDGKKIDPPKVADYVTFPIKDIVNKEQLIKIGESIYEEMSRQQIEGNFTTYEMLIPEETFDDKGVRVKTTPVDFSSISNGTGIRIYMKQDDLKAIGTKSTESEKIAFLMRRGYDKKFAKAFASSLDRINTAFYTKSVRFELDQENGFTMALEFINFIDIDSALQGH